MIVKKYVVTSMNEAMDRIRQELGKDAIIISQRKIKRPGLRGLFSPKILEVTAAVDSKKSDIDENMKNSIDAIKKVMEKKSPSTKDKVYDEKYFPKDEILAEMQQMKEMIANISQTAITTTDLNKSKLYKTLEESGLNERVIKKILTRVRDMDESIEEEEKVKIAIEDMINISHSNMEGPVVFVGPTGVGKTTTIAKIAGKLALIEKKKVGLITVDTYRIGAVEQLSTYADIMSIPFEAVFSVKEMGSALESMKDCEVILIDTTGRNSKNAMQIAELNSFVQKANSKNIYMVISSTTKNKDIDAILQGYKVLNFNNVIITKLDETTTYGSILNILDSAEKPLSFVTTGQNVPDDFKELTAEEISRLILGEDLIC
ncbi:MULTISPECIES: flagellar biosynthesis protein FlhF [Clostridium]|nr:MULTISPECIES: flagellar biosynthesis protein FlhF [Clostridium]MBE6044747.1 flagellar biosynthesis protein FlhF [Clostridium thermopalmarium]